MLWDVWNSLFRASRFKAFTAWLSTNGHPLLKQFPLTGFLELHYNPSKLLSFEPIELQQEFRLYNFPQIWLFFKFSPLVEFFVGAVLCVAFMVTWVLIGYNIDYILLCIINNITYISNKITLVLQKWSIISIYNKLISFKNILPSPSVISYALISFVLGLNYIIILVFKISERVEKFYKLYLFKKRFLNSNNPIKILVPSFWFFFNRWSLKIKKSIKKYKKKNK